MSTGEFSQRDGTTKPKLNVAARLWQTPSSQQFEAADLDRLLERQAEAKAKGTNGNGFGLPLANEVQIWARDRWPTPATRDYKGSNSADHVVTNGTGRMHAFRCSPPGQQTSAGPTSSPERRTLNPLFVEWLMGWPIGWTGSAPVETASSHWWRDMRGELSRLVSRQTQATLL